MNTAHRACHEKHGRGTVNAKHIEILPGRQPVIRLVTFFDIPAVFRNFIGTASIFSSATIHRFLIFRSSGIHLSILPFTKFSYRRLRYTSDYERTEGGLYQQSNHKPTLSTNLLKETNQ